MVRETILRVFATILGLIAALLGLVINFLYSSTHDVLALSGHATATTHGWIGLVLLIIGIIGAFLAVPRAEVAAVLLLISCIGLFFVLHVFAIFVSPFLFIAAAMAWLDRPGQPLPAR